MTEEKYVTNINEEEERARIKAETDAQMLRSKLNDYIAIVLALGTVLLLWLLQMAGLY
jgi:hypothetical protein